MQNAYDEDGTLERLVNAWHDAVNRGDVDAARALVTDPVEVSGPRAAQTISAQAFADWVVTSGIRLRPRSAHPVDGVTMVVEQDATWPGTTDSPRAAATLFKVAGGALSVIRRFESLHEALRAASNEGEPGVRTARTTHLRYQRGIPGGESSPDGWPTGSFSA